MKSAWHKQAFSKRELPSPESDRPPGTVLGTGTQPPGVGTGP